MNLVIMVDLNIAVNVVLRVLIYGSCADGSLIVVFQQIVLEFFERWKPLASCYCLLAIEFFQILLQPTAYRFCTIRVVCCLCPL